uniref:UDP-N-acetylglucosamine--peptide N-acetylglucosaminyltransferase SPINDLY n=1 Tax=Heterosigma akashiwo TaxID=2829 RepID=A0A7S4DBA7_HETAK
MSGLFGCFCLDEKKDGLGMDQEGDNTILAIDLYNKGTVAQAKGNLEEAINFYKQSISLDGENFKAFYNLGSALQETAAGLQQAAAAAGAGVGAGFDRARRRTVLDACAAYEQAIDLKEDHVLAHYNLGYIRHQLGQHARALHHLEEAARLDPADVDTFIMIGNILRETRRFPEAVERYRAAAAIDGGCVMALYNLANTLHDLRRFDEAIKYFLQALDLEPNLTHAHFNLGISYQAKQDIENAFQAYSRAAKLDPGFEDARAAAQRMKRKLDGRQHSQSTSSYYSQNDRQNASGEYNRDQDSDPGKQNGGRG